jgi:hypothetical protein
MGMPTRRAVLSGTAAFAGLAAAQASGLASAAEAKPAGATSRRAKANVLLVHGAWVDGSSWSQVIAILQRHGHNVVAVQLPLTSLADLDQVADVGGQLVGVVGRDVVRPR